MQKRIRQRIVNILKSKPAVFAPSFIDMLLFTTDSARSELFKEVKKNGILQNKVINSLYGNQLSRFNNLQWYYNSKLSDVEAIKYAGFIVSLFGSKIERFEALRKEYEVAYLSSSYESALNILNRIDNEICISLWSCGQRFLIKELAHGLEGNKQELSRVAESIDDNIVLIILYYYSNMVEKGLSYDNYQEGITKFLKQLKRSALAEYLGNKLSFDSMYQFNNASLTLQLDSQISLIDLFLSLEKFLPTCIENDICNGVCSVKDLENTSIDCKLLNNVGLLLNTDGFLYPKTPDCNLFFEIIETYTAGKYEDVIVAATDYLQRNPNDFQIAVILCKSLILNDDEFPEEIDISYLPYVHSIYKSVSNYKESVLKLKQELKQNHGSILGMKIFAFMQRKNIVNGNKSCVFASSFLDTYLHPNFARFLNGNQLEAFADKMSTFAPVSILVARGEKNGDFAAIPENAISNRTMRMSRARYYCRSGQYQDAQKELDALHELTYDKTEYSAEKIVRIQLMVYAGTGDHQKAISLLVHTYFENKFLFDKLMSSGIYEAPRRIRNAKLQASVLYPIFIYLSNPADYQKQIIAYNNFVDLNGYRTIIQALEAADFKCNHQMRFFFERVCSVNLLKRDATLHMLNITPETVRIQILLKLLDYSDSKDYFLEINSILTSETLKDNLKTINKSRINADTDKIFMVNQNKWKETYEKYLTLRGINTSFVEVDLKNSNLSLASVETVHTNRQRVSQEVLVFRSLVDQILEECLFSAQHGLDTYLSSRIRHGYCKGQLTTFLSELHLLSFDSNDDDTDYLLDQYWQKKVKTDTSAYMLIRKTMSNFTKKIESQINEVLNNWLRIKYHNDQNGMFDYTRLYHVLCGWGDEENALDFSTFYHGCIDLFWDLTRKLLAILRNRIRNELTPFYFTCIDELLAEFQSAPIDNSIKQEIVSQCNVAKSKVVQVMREFEEVFYVNNADYNNFTMKDLVDSCKRIVTKLHNDTGHIDWIENVDDTFIFSGKAFLPFVDIICILLSNAIEHSGINSTEKLSIKINIGEVTDTQSLIYSSIPGVYDGCRVMSISISNSLGQKVDREVLRSRIDSVFEEVRRNVSDRSFVQKEGGSGLHKLCNTASNSIEAAYCILYDVGEEVMFEYGFVIDKILCEEEQLESIIG